MSERSEARRVDPTADAASQSVLLLDSKSTDGVDGDDGATLAAASVSSELVVNELLAYVGIYRKSANDVALHQTVRAFYSPADIAVAKRILVQKFQSSLGSCALLSDIRNSSSIRAHDSEIDDMNLRRTGSERLKQMLNRHNHVTFLLATLISCNWMLMSNS